jgi:cysteinyl-tRNA synthetase
LTATAKPAAYLLKKAATFMTKMLRVLGVVDGNEDIGWSVGGTDDFETKIPPFVDALVGFRDKVSASVCRCTCVTERMYLEES